MLILSDKVQAPMTFPLNFLDNSGKLSHLFSRMTQGLTETGKIPPHMHIGNITVILKPNIDSTLTSSYRSSSIINTDIKIINKGLSTKIEIVSPPIIHIDQTGVIKGSHAFNNEHYIIHQVTQNNEQ